MQYKSVTTIKEIHDYLGNSPIISLDIETAPSDKYRGEEKAALDAHKSNIAGISFSVTEGTAIYVPLTHRSGKNAEDQKALMDYLTAAVFQNPKVIKVAHNLSFEARKDVR